MALKRTIGLKILNGAIIRKTNYTHTGWDYKTEKKYHAGRPCRAVLKIDLNTKEIISEYSSISEATRKNNMRTSSNIRAVCKGLRNHAGGYGWKYREEVMKCSR